MNTKETPRNTVAATLIALNRWTREAGVSDTTVWRWRRRGMLRGCVNIAGKLYIPTERIEEFRIRAAGGEFAKPPSGAAAKATRARHAKEAGDE